MINSDNKSEGDCWLDPGEIESRDDDEVCGEGSTNQYQPTAPIVVSSRIGELYRPHSAGITQGTK